MLLFISCRPNWIGIYGARFYRGDLVCLNHKMMDDLPVFEKITDILVLVKTPLIAIEKFRTKGINNAYRISVALIVIPYYLTFLLNALFVLIPISYR